jgi:hypothetical protein
VIARCGQIMYIYPYCVQVLDQRIKRPLTGHPVRQAASGWGERDGLPLRPRFAGDRVAAQGQEPGNPRRLPDQALSISPTDSEHGERFLCFWVIGCGFGAGAWETGRRVARCVGKKRCVRSAAG